MAVIFKQVGGTAIFSADAEVQTKSGVLEVSFVETQRIAGGDLNGVLQDLNGVLQVSWNGKPLVISSSSVKPGARSESKRVRWQFRVYGANKVNALSGALALAFGKLRKELVAFEQNNTVTLRLPCFIRLPLCRITETQYIIACRLRGRPAIECLREAEAIYINCKRNC